MSRANGLTVCFVNTVAPSAFEVRMLKEAKALQAAGFEVVILVRHAEATMIEGVRIVPLPRVRGRLMRMTMLPLRALIPALQTRASVYHLHSPELIPVGFLLRLLGKRVIYDAHEYYGEKILGKHYLPRWVRPSVRKLILWLERRAARAFDHVFVADSATLRALGPGRLSVVPNYADLSAAVGGELGRDNLREAGGTTAAVYAGQHLTRDRGLAQVLDAARMLDDVPFQLHLIGSLDADLEGPWLAQQERVVYHGHRSHGEVLDILSSCHIGLVLFQPVPAYRYAAENTTKLFEYMAAGLAIVASDFPGLRRLVEDAGCGLLVDPTSPAAIASAIRMLHRDRELRRRLGECGRRAVQERYNWRSAARELLSVYFEMTQSGVRSPLAGGPH